MTTAWIYVVSIIVSYLIGSIPTGYLVVKRLTGQDIREFGSGGTGATNVRRVAGKPAAIFVLFVDFHKGLVPVILAKALFPDLPWVHMAAAFASIMGHSKSIFLGFSGGKSAATGLGNLTGLFWPTGLLVGLSAFVITKLSRIQSIGSMTAAVIGILCMWFFHAPTPYLVYAIIAASYIIYLHRANIVRLIKGTENRI